MLVAKMPFGGARREGPAVEPRKSYGERYQFDADYVRRLTAGDPEAEAHFTKYFGDLLAIKLRGRLRSAALIEDAKQETFMRVVTTLKQKRGLDNPASLGAFVNAVCNNVLFELYRSESRAIPFGEDEPELETAIDSAEVALARAEERERVRQAIAELPQKDKDLLRWLFFEDRDKDDVCRELNVDRQYLRVLLHRAKLRFKAEFNAATSPA